MRPANERRSYIVTSSPIGWVHTQNDAFRWETSLVTDVLEHNQPLVVNNKHVDLTLASVQGITWGLYICMGLCNGSSISDDKLCIIFKPKHSINIYWGNPGFTIQTASNGDLNYKIFLDLHSHFYHIWHQHLNILMLRQNGRHFADRFFKCIFLNENVSISIRISLNFFLMFQMTIMQCWFR